MPGKKVSILLTALAAFVIILSTVTEGTEGDCAFTLDAGATGEEGLLAQVYICYPDGECKHLLTQEMGLPQGSLDVVYNDIPIDKLRYCTIKGRYIIKAHVDIGVHDLPFPGASDGYCTVNAHYVDWETEEFCKSECMDDGRTVRWRSASGCCGDSPAGDCASIISSYICYSNADRTSWYWRLKSTRMGNIVSIGCDPGEFTTTGTGFFVCDSSTTSIMGTVEGNSYLCSSENLYECARTDPSHRNTVASGNLKLINSSQSGYYCVATTPGASSTRWDNSPDCTGFCSTDPTGECCTDAGTVDLWDDHPPYVAEEPLMCQNACHFPRDCGCGGWSTTFICAPDDTPICTTAETDDGTQCFMTTTSIECSWEGWTDCTTLDEGVDVDSSKAECPGSEDGPGGFPVGTECYYTAQTDICTTGGWTCTNGASDTKDEIPSIIGGGTTCRYGIDTALGNAGCLADSGWQYLDDSERAYCVDNGEISPDGKCFYEDRSGDTCETGTGWNCVNGSSQTPAEKPIDCTYHTGICTESGGKWNPDCLLHYGCTGEKCVADSGWECFGGVYATEPAIDIDTSCATCTDCDMNGDCDSTEIAGNPLLDNDGDGVLNVCEPDETPELEPTAPELDDPDYSDPNDECADGFDNDDDGTCDYHGCVCQASNNYCGKGVAWDGQNMPADEDCSSTCDPCSECGFGFFNICDLDECTSCLPLGDCTFQDILIPFGDYCCLDEDHDTFCEDNPDGGSAFGEGLNDPIEDQCNADPANPLTIFETAIEFMDDNKDDDTDEIKDCLDEYLGCDLDGECKPYGWGDETCDCPDCNLSAFPCQAWPGTVCIQKGDRSTWECMDWDDNSYNCEMHDLLTDQGNCDTGGEISCWDEPYLGTVPAAKCCGDDGGSDLWQNPGTSGCSMGTFYLNPDNDATGILCNFDDSTQVLGVDCQDGITQASCWYDEPDPACCGDDILEYQTYSNDNVACCPRDNDYAEAGGICIPQSTYLHPTETAAAAATTALGSEVGSLTDGVLHPYNQTVTLLKAGGDPLFEIEGQFSALDRPDSIPPANIGFVDLSGLRITDDSSSIYFNMTWLRNSRPSNRISDEYSVYIPNINFGIGITVCVDPQDPFTEAEYGDECETATEFTRPKSASGFTVEITEYYYKITTNLEERYDWYAFVHVQPDLYIESDADLMTKRSFETVGFYAELKSGGTSIPDAACKLFYHDGLNVTMKYNETFEKYYYERTYSGKGLYEWEVRCSHPFYLPVSTSATASIKPNSELIIYDITDSKTRMINETVDFFAFFRGLPDQNLIETASCNITFHEETSETMTLDEDENGEKYFSEDRKYMNYGTFSYAVKCAEDGYDTMTTVDVVEIFPTTCNVTRSDDEALVAGKANFNVISKRGFVLLKKAE